jgi:hypothetical protein
MRSLPVILTVACALACAGGGSERDDDVSAAPDVPTLPSALSQLRADHLGGSVIVTGRAGKEPHAVRLDGGGWTVLGAPERAPDALARGADRLYAWTGQRLLSIAPGAESWTDHGAPSADGRLFAHVAPLGDGRLLLVAQGRCVLEDATVAGAATRAPAWAFDGATWAALPEVAGIGRAHGAVPLPDGGALVVGASDPCETEQIADATSVFAGGRWATGPRLESPRFDFDAVALPDGRVVVAGNAGHEGARGAFAEIVSRDGTVAAAAPALDARIAFSLALLPDGRVWLAGGAPSQGSSEPPGAAVADTWLLDPSKGVWSEGPALREARADHAAVVLEDGRVLVVGGTGANGQPLASTETHRP